MLVSMNTHECCTRSRWKQHVKVIAQNLKHDGGFNGAGVSSLHVSKVSKKVLRILSACALLESAEGMSNVSNLSPMSPEALSWLGVSVAVVLVLIGFGYLISTRAIRLGGPDRGGINDEPIQNDGMDDIYAPEGHEDSASVESASTDYGLPLSDLQERIFLVLDRGNHSEEAICEWMTSRCSRRLAIAESSDRETVMFYHDCLVALANARRNLLTCDEQERQNIFGYLRSVSRMSPRECSPTREMDMESLLEEQRRFRYRFIPLEEASDPDVWQDVRHGGPNSDSDSPMADASGEPDDEPMPETERYIRDIHERRSRALRRIRRQLQDAYDTGTQEEIWELEAEQDWWTSII